MDVADDLVSEIAVDPLDGFPDDRRAQMADVQGLGDVRAAVVQHHGTGGNASRHAEARLRAHLLQMCREIFRLHTQIQEARLYRLRRGKHLAALQLCRDILRDEKRRLVFRPGRGHRAIALKLAQIGTVGNRHLPAGGIIARRAKGGRHRL